METSTPPPFIPANIKGKATDLYHTVTEATTEDAIATFGRACLRLRNPSLWQGLAGLMSASFKLISKEESRPHHQVDLHDYIIIDIPGPGAAAGDGFDWVTVEDIKTGIDDTADCSFGIRLRACANPNKIEKGTAHFFKEDATSTFIIKRSGKTITASYHGRNETPNTKDTTLIDTIRNSIVAAGAILGISELQWTALIKGLLDKEGS